jgi:hypothetical protein
MKLLVEELKTTLSQSLTVGDNNVFAVAVRPHLYKHGSPTGSVRMQIQDENGKLIAQSAAVAISAISSENYFHGYVRFDFTEPLKSGSTYQFVLSSTGYTYSSSAFVGWCKDFDLRKYPSDYSPSDGMRSSFDLEIWELRTVSKGSY